MSNDRMLDALCGVVDLAFREGRFYEVNEWLKEIDIDWLFKKNRSILLGWLVITCVANDKLPFRSEFHKKAAALFPEHQQWMENLK